MNASWKKWILIGLRLGFGVLLIAASIDKILNPREFAETVFNYQVIGEGVSLWIAVSLPFLETMVGLLLILNIWPDTTTWINALLMSAFLVLVTQAYFRGLNISCGCFKINEPEVIGINKILLNICFAGLAWVLVWLKKPFSHQKSSDQIPAADSS